MSYAALRDKIVAFTDKECGQGTPFEEIARTETALGVVFPQVYRQFLHEFSWARFAHQELYGVGPSVPPHLELIRNTEAERTQMHPRLLPYLIPIMNDGSGNHYCLNTQEIHDAECPVVLWDHELGETQTPLPVAGTFEAWLGDMLSRMCSGPAA